MLSGGSESSFTGLPIVVGSGGIFTSTIFRPLSPISNKCLKGCVGTSSSMFSRMILVLLTVTNSPRSREEVKNKTLQLRKVDVPAKKAKKQVYSTFPEAKLGGKLAQNHVFAVPPKFTIAPSWGKALGA